MKIGTSLEGKDAEVVTSAGVGMKDPSTSGSGGLQVEEKRSRRAWEQWSLDDIATFFEGLNEFGKDFDAIQNCLCARSRRSKSIVERPANAKNKDQVRHFYYRTWHKISKYLQAPEAAGKRVHKELYGLVNYGEMWKKLGGFFNDRCGEKLNELVLYGVTSIKIKGKSHRIKTPVCPALKRLQSPDVEIRKPVVPDRIVLELTPGCNADFLRVQSVAHNPRIRICSESSSFLSNIIQFLTKKWKPRSISVAESAAEDELIMRLAPDTKQQQAAVSGNAKKSRRLNSGGQDQLDESEPTKLESKPSWTVDPSEHVTIGEVYSMCGATDGRLPLTYTWERRSQLNPSEQSLIDDCESVPLLRALVNVAKSCLTKANAAADCPKKNRKQLLLPNSLEDAQSPLSETSPSTQLTESPIHFSRIRQRLRRPLRYGSNLKRGALALTLNKMPGPGATARCGSSMTLAAGGASSAPGCSMQQQSSTTFNISWPSQENNSAPLILQVRLDGHKTEPQEQPESHVTVTEGNVSPDRESFRPPSILLHTPVKSGSSIWGSASNAPSLPSTPQRLQEWMSILLPNTPEKGGIGGGGIGGGEMAQAFSETITSLMGDGFAGAPSTTSSVHNGEGSSWPIRDGDEISLSSLLNQLVSPAKSTASSRYTDFRLPFDLQSLVADNSVDLTAKFAELAASIAKADASIPKTRP